MRTVRIDKAGCTLLFLLMKENSFQRENTIRTLGHPVFDTASGTVHYLEFPGPLAEELPVRESLAALTEAELQMLADLRLVPSPLVERLGVRSRFPTRYVGVPVPHPELAYRWHDYSESEREELSANVIDWLEKLGHERDIHFQYQICDLSY